MPVADSVRYNTVTEAIKACLTQRAAKGATFTELTAYVLSHKTDYIDTVTPLKSRLAQDLLCLHRKNEILQGFILEEHLTYWFATQSEVPACVWIPPAIYESDKTTIDWMKTLENLFRSHKDGFTNYDLLQIFYAHLYFVLQDEPTDIAPLRGYLGALSKKHLIVKTEDRWQIASSIPKLPDDTFTLTLNLPFVYDGLQSVCLDNPELAQTITYHRRAGFNLGISSTPPGQSTQTLPPLTDFTGQIILTDAGGTTQTIEIYQPTTLYVSFLPK